MDDIITLDEELLLGDAETLGVSRRQPIYRRTRKVPGAGWYSRMRRWQTKEQLEVFNRKKAARAKEIAAQVEPTDGKCPKGYHLDWAKRPVLMPGMVGMPAPRKVCQPDKPGTPPTPRPPPGRYIAGPEACGTRTEGRGITWGRILPQYRRLSRAERQTVVDKICGRAPTRPMPVIPDEAVRKKLLDQYTAAKSKYDTLMAERKPISDQLKQKNADIVVAKRAVQAAQRQLGMVRPMSSVIQRYRRRR